MFYTLYASHALLVGIICHNNMKPVFYFPVGSNSGEITLWEVGIREKLVTKPFKIWELQSCSLPFQVKFLGFAYMFSLYLCIYF